MPKRHCRRLFRAILANEMLTDRMIVTLGLRVSSRIACLISFSGHTIKHVTVKAERGIDGSQPMIDDMAHLFHVHKHAPPLLLLFTGDRDLDLLGHYEENAYLWRMIQVVKHLRAE